MEELGTNQQLLFSETQRPFMSLFPSQKSLIWWSYPLQRDEVITKGSKLYIQPIIKNTYGTFTEKHCRRIFIVSSNA